MNQFIDGSPIAFAALFEQCRSAGVVFANQPLPPGCDPATARIAFEGLPEGGVKLMIDRCVRYSGSNAAMTEWIASGQLMFPTPSALQAWCHRELRQAFGLTDTGAATEPPAHPPASTDLEAVQRHMRDRQVGRSLILPTSLSASLKTVVMGQDQALDAMAERVASHVNRLRPRRPATLFLVGTTGTGKTRSAEKIVSQLQQMGDSGMRFLRLDMNEYHESHRISQLLGSPQGYVGYGDGAQLTKQLAQHPRSVVLFDEIEKAHPAILLALMNAMDAGRLTSPTAFNGSNEIDCRQAIFVFTSNLDAAGILSELAANPEATQNEINALCRDHMVRNGIRPELAARISTYAVFRPLRAPERLLVMLSAIQDIAQEYGVKVRNIEPAIVANLMSSGDARFGARADEYRIDSLLGLCLAKAAAQGHACIDIQGDPPAAVPVEANMASVSATTQPVLPTDLAS